MNAPLPHILRPPSNERDQTIIRPQGVDDVCLQVPTTSDYLIPLPGITHLHQQQQQLQEHQQQQQQHPQDTIDPSFTIAVSTGTNICTPPGVSSPSAPHQLIKEEEHTNATNEGCWETSFILPNSKSDQPLLNNNNNNSSGSQKSINTASIGAQGPGNTSGYSSSSQRSPVSNGLRTIQSSTTPAHEDEETKLISLDTPQPTPTTIQPPLSFSSQLDGITLDPAALTKSLNNTVTVPNATAAAATTTTNTNLNNKHSSYANIQMMSTSVNNLKGGGGTCGSDSTSEKLNATLLHNGSNGLTKMNGNLATNGGTGAPPFTIQGYAERYKDKHSEISC